MILLLRLAIVALLGVLVVLQVLSLPGQFRHMAVENPDDAWLRWPLTAVTVFWVLCAQVVLVATWQLLRRVEADRIFDEASFRWVDAIIGAVGAAWIVLAAVLVAVGLSADDPGIVVLLIVLTAAVTVAGLLMIVMRALLRQATTLRTDLDEVI